MNIDDKISDSFSLDFEILKNSSILERTRYHTPKLSSDDIFKEFEKYVNQTKQTLTSFSLIFDLCNEQRKLFRVALIKLLKEKQLLEKTTNRTKSEISSQMFRVHEELKDHMIEKLGNKLARLNEDNTNLSKALEAYEKTINHLKYSFHINNNNPQKIKSTASVSKHGNRKSDKNIKNPETKDQPAKQSIPYKKNVSSQGKKETKFRTIDVSTVENTFSYENLSQRMNTVTNELDEVFDTIPDFESLNRISSSPINTPRNFKSKVNLFADDGLANFGKAKVESGDVIQIFDPQNISFDTIEPPLLTEHLNISSMNVNSTALSKSNSKQRNFRSDQKKPKTKVENYSKALTQRNFENLRKSIHPEKKSSQNGNCKGAKKLI